jgi:hypothetical protein
MAVKNEKSQFYIKGGKTSGRQDPLEEDCQ